MKKEISISNQTHINASINEVYNVLINIEKWKDWTESINEISYISNPRFEIGNKVLIKQPKLFPAIWTITEITKNKSFAWQTKTLGVSITAIHNLSTTAEVTRVENKLIYKGMLAYFMFTLSSKLSEEYLTMEINGLKNVCEKTHQNDAR